MHNALTDVERFLETADVARAEGIVTASVRADVAAGRLPVAAVTARGTRLFRREDVEEYSRNRRRRGLDRTRMGKTA
jgi:hypothetical protein